MRIELSGRRSLVSGSTAGIGYAIARPCRGGRRGSDSRGRREGVPCDRATDLAAGQIRDYGGGGAPGGLRVLAPGRGNHRCGSAGGWRRRAGDSLKRFEDPTTVDSLSR